MNILIGTLLTKAGVVIGGVAATIAIGFLIGTAEKDENNE